MKQYLFTSSAAYRAVQSASHVLLWCDKTDQWIKQNPLETLRNIEIAQEWAQSDGWGEISDNVHVKVGGTVVYIWNSNYMTTQEIKKLQKRIETAESNIKSMGLDNYMHG